MDFFVPTWIILLVSLSCSENSCSPVAEKRRRKALSSGGFSSYSGIICHTEINGVSVEINEIHVLNNTIRDQRLYAYHFSQLWHHFWHCLPSLQLLKPQHEHGHITNGNHMCAVYKCVCGCTWSWNVSSGVTWLSAASSCRANCTRAARKNCPPSITPGWPNLHTPPESITMVTHLICTYIHSKEIRRLVPSLTCQNCSFQPFFFEMKKLLCHGKGFYQLYQEHYPITCETVICLF